MNSRINKIGITDHHTEAEVIKINALVMLSLSIALAGFLWSLMYALLGYYVPAIFPVSYSVSIFITLFIFNKNQNFKFLLRTKLFLILVLPFLLQMSLGGFMPSGAVFFWSLLAPIGALMFSNIKEAILWFAFFIVLFVLCLFCGKINAFKYDLIPPIIQQVFLGMNITGVALVSFFTTMFFVKSLQKEQYKNKVLLKIKAEKEKEINDSINYARYIQESILTNPTKIKNHFEDSFILSKPKNVVSGDFYWLNEEEDRIMVAVADSTGHGVPGAMVSLVCSNALNSSVVEYGLKDPDLILNKTREIVVNSFSGGHNMSDGMDISFCNFNKEKSKLCYAGALNPIYIIRGDDLIELKGDRFPIGKYISNEPYTKQEVDIKKGDCIYLFSDGYFDQFGGVNSKKMKSGNFKKLLLKVSNKSMINQKEELVRYFQEWIGNVEQIDDVLVVGIRI